MLARLITVLDEIIEEKSTNNNQKIIETKLEYAAQLLELIPDKELFDYKNKENESMLFIFARANFLRGIQYYKNKKKSLLEKLADGRTPWDIAIYHNSDSILNYYTLFIDVSLIIPNNLYRAIYLSNLSDFKKLLKSDKNSINDANLDAFRYATFLGQWEMAKILLDHDELIDQFKIDQALLSTLICGNRKLADLILDYLFAKNKIDNLEKYIDEIDTKHSLSTWFIDLYFEKMSQQPKLTNDEKVRLITVVLKSMLEKSKHKTTQEFIDLFNRALSLIPAVDEKAHEKIKNIISSMVLTYLNDEQNIPWELQIQSNQILIKPSLEAHLNKDSKSTYLSFAEKLNCHPYLAAKNLFTPEELINLLIQSIHNKQPNRFYYFLDANKNNLSYCDEIGNNLLYIAAKSGFDVAVYLLQSLKPELMSQKNSRGELPLALVPKTSPLKKLTDSTWKPYHDIKAKFIGINCFQNTTITHAKWGTMSCKLAEYLTHIDQAIVAIKKKLPPIVLLACYADISEYLFHTLTLLWTNPHCNHANIIKLLNQYHSLSEHHKFEVNHERYQKIYSKCLIASFSRFGNQDKALALTQATLETELKRKQADSTYANYLKLLLLGLMAKKVIKQEMILPITNLTQNPTECLLTTIVLQLITPREQTTHLSLKTYPQIVNYVENDLYFSANKNQANTTDRHEYEYAIYVEACGVFAKWFIPFFAKDKKINEKNAMLITDFTNMFLGKLKFSLQYLNDAIGGISPPLSAQLEFYVNLINKELNLLVPEETEKYKSITNPADLAKLSISSQLGYQVEVDIKPLTSAQILQLPEQIEISDSESDDDSIINNIEAINLIERLKISLQRLYKRTTSKEMIAFEKNMAIQLLSLIPLEDLVTYTDQNQNIAFCFTNANLVEGIKYLIEHNKKDLLSEKNAQGLNAYQYAVFIGATDIVDYYINDLKMDSLALFTNELEKSILLGKINEVNQIIASANASALSQISGQLMQSAVRLNHFEIVKLLSETDKTKTQVNFIESLFLAILFQKPNIAEYLIGQMSQQKRIQDILPKLTELYDLNIPIESFSIKPLIKSLTDNPNLAEEEKINLIRIILMLMFESAIYTTEKEFKDDLNSIMSLVSKNDKQHSKVMHIIASIIRSHDNNKPIASLYDKPASISFWEKILYTNLSPQQIFSEQEWTELLVKSIKDVSGPMFYCFIDKNKLSYQDANGNNLAHIAVQYQLYPAVEYCYQELPELFSQENKDSQLPRDLSQESKLFRTTSETNAFCDVQARYFVKESYQYTLIDHEKWGTIPRAFAYYLTQLEHDLAELETIGFDANNINDYYENVTRYLRHVIKKLWSNSLYNQKAIVKLCWNYYEIGIKHNLLSKSDLLYLIMTFSRCGENEKALEIAKKILRDYPKKDLIDIMNLEFVILGLYVSQTTDKTLIENYYSYLEQAATNDQSMLSTVFFKLIASTDSVANLSKETLVQFKKNIDEWVPTSLLKLDMTYTSQHSLFCYLESFLVLLKWTNRYFNLPKNNDIDYQNAISIAKTKLSFFKKLDTLLNNVETIMEKHAVYYKNKTIKTKYHFCKNKMNKAMESAKKNLENLKKEYKESIKSKLGSASSASLDKDIQVVTSALTMSDMNSNRISTSNTPTATNNNPPSSSSASTSITTANTNRIPATSSTNSSSIKNTNTNSYLQTLLSQPPLAPQNNKEKSSRITKLQTKTNALDTPLPTPKQPASSSAFDGTTINPAGPASNTRGKEKKGDKLLLALRPRTIQMENESKTNPPPENSDSVSKNASDYQQPTLTHISNGPVPSAPLIQTTAELIALQNTVTHSASASENIINKNEQPIGSHTPNGPVLSSTVVSTEGSTASGNNTETDLEKDAEKTDSTPSTIKTRYRSKSFTHTSPTLYAISAAQNKYSQDLEDNEETKYKRIIIQLANICSSNLIVSNPEQATYYIELKEKFINDKDIHEMNYYKKIIGDLLNYISNMQIQINSDYQEKINQKAELISFSNNLGQKTNQEIQAFFATKTFTPFLDSPMHSYSQPGFYAILHLITQRLNILDDHLYELQNKKDSLAAHSKLFSLAKDMLADTRSDLIMKIKKA